MEKGCPLNSISQEIMAKLIKGKKFNDHRTLKPKFLRAVLDYYIKNYPKDIHVLSQVHKDELFNALPDD